MTINFKSVFWVWFVPTSAAAVLGETSISGGQVHIGLGRSGAEVQTFLRGLHVSRVGREWQLPLEPFSSLSSFVLPLTENPASNIRVSECRIPRQSPRSGQVYPLWQMTVKLIAKGTLPQQVLLILRDQKDKLHARVLNINELNRLPPKIAQIIFQNRNQEQHTLAKSGVFADAAVPLPLTASTRHTRKPPITRPQNPNQTTTDWESLAAYVREMEDKPRATRTRAVEQKLRDPKVRTQALKCFGHRCQVQNCTCTAGLPNDWLSYVVDAHHIKAVAKGGSDSLFNISILCANHHRIFERLPNLDILVEAGSDDFVLYTKNEAFLVERDLKLLRQALGR